MGFKDILKKSFLENISMADYSVKSIILTMAIVAIIGLYIFLVYRIVTRKAFYSKSFNVSLVALAMITAAIILTIQSSVIISLGMVGALSIVRFRTAIKDPMDLVFLFWSISVGIICGAGLNLIAVLLSVAVSIVIFLLELIPVVKAPMILMINSADIHNEKEIKAVIAKYASNYKVKSCNMSKQGMNMVVELRIKEGAAMITELADMENISSVSLLEHDGEVTY